jgi:MFS family permease
VLSDSSVVILALPEILRKLNASVGSLAWVITGFNLALGLCALPAALLARRRDARHVYAVGLIVFAAASVGCAASTGLPALIAARVVQAVGGAAAVCAALELLVTSTGSNQRAIRIWVAAGVLGAAAGPAAGGLLTQLISWQAVFLVQAPLAILAIGGALGPAPARERDARIPRPDVPANAALALLSASLTAALFLIVLLLVEGWRRTPIAAAITVSVMPVMAIVATRIPHSLGSRFERAAAGAIAIAGGLAGLSVLPHAGPAWTVVPQMLIGLGLGLGVGSLSEMALERRDPLGLHGGWTIASRHLGVVLGLVLLTPVFTADLTTQENAAKQAGAKLLLDANLSFSRKVELALALVSSVDSQKGHVPDVRPAFASVRPSGSERPEFDRIEAEVIDQVERAGTHAFSRSFGLAAALALASLVPALVASRREKQT